MQLWKTSHRKDSVQLTKTSITTENIPINLQITFKEPTHKSRSLTGLVLELAEKPNQKSHFLNHAPCCHGKLSNVRFLKKLFSS